MEHDGAVVVGVATGWQDTAGLDWAAREAHTRGRELHVLNAFVRSDFVRAQGGTAEGGTDADLRRAAEQSVDDAVMHLRRLWPELRVRGEVVDGDALELLCAASAGAEVTVLGPRQPAGAELPVAGSLSSAVAAGGSGPVVVVAASPDDPDAPCDVVVGVDGSELMDSALAFAFDYASRHERELHAILCWSPDGLALMHWGAEPPTPGRAARWLAEAVAGWQEKYPDVVTRRDVIREFPVPGLIAASTGQDLLVVGSRSKHARLGTVLGSVSQGVLHHATCSVAVIHPRRR